MQLGNIKKTVRRPWLVLLPVLAFGALASAALLVSASIGIKMVERYVPLQDASMMIKHELAMFHLALHKAAETGSGDQAKRAYAHLDSAEKNARLMLEGGKGPDGAYQPLDDPELIKDIANVMGELREMRVSAGKYLSPDGGKRVTPEEDMKFDATFEHVLFEADMVEGGLHEKIEANLLEYEVLTAALFLSALVFSAIAGITLYRYADRQSGYITALTEYGILLEDKERDLAQALGKVRESEGKFRVLVEKSLVGVYIIQDGRFRYVNPTFCDVFGYTADEVLSKEHFMEMVLPEDRPLVDEKVADRLSGRVESVRYASRWLRKDGDVIDIDVMGALTEYEGRPAIIGTLLDITERKRAEERIKRSETKYRIIADNTFDWEFWIAPDGRFLYTSPSCERVTGHAAKEFEEDPGLFSRILHPADAAGFESHRHDIGETPGGMEFRIIRPDGAERWIEHLCQPVYDEKGAFLGHRGNNRDITGRKRLERERADFYAMVTHDLKSPLSAIMGYAELLQTLKSECIEGEPAEMVAGISRSAGKLLRLVEDFLAVSRLESGRFPVSAVPDKVADALRDTVSEFVAIARNKGLVFSADLPEGLPKASLDRKLVARAVANLLQNAVNYTPSGGSVTLSASAGEGGGWLAISVRDTGPGIPPGEREKVFEKYYRSAGTSSVRGSGLGLTIVKAVAEAHGGRVELYCPEDGGSEFRLYLPAAG